MKFWITKNSTVTVRDQIVMQVQAAIASGDLKPGDKLSSTRELSRRFSIHPNTVSAAFRRLIADGLVEMRKGSGIFVRNNGCDTLDILISRFYREIEETGFSRDEAIDRILSERLAGSIKGFSLFEPNDDLAEIIIYEVENGTGLQVERVLDPRDSRADFKLIALFDEGPRIKEFDARGCLYLNANSIARSLPGRVKPKVHEIVAVVSGWSDFLEFARLFLLAAGVDPASVVTVSTRSGSWKRSLRTASMIISDRAAAARLPKIDNLISFPVLSADSIAELKKLAGGENVAPA